MDDSAVSNSSTAALVSSATALPRPVVVAGPAITKCSNNARTAAILRQMREEYIGLAKPVPLAIDPVLPIDHTYPNSHRHVLSIGVDTDQHSPDGRISYRDRDRAA